MEAKKGIQHTDMSGGITAELDSDDLNNSNTGQSEYHLTKPSYSKLRVLPQWPVSRLYHAISQLSYVFPLHLLDPQLKQM